MRHVAYIRQPEAIQYLAKQLNSEERLPALKPRVQGSRVCQYALDHLAQIVVDFPIKSIGIGYSNEQVNQARQWMKEHPTPKVKGLD